MKQRRENILSTYAIFDPADEGGYNVSFPDFPGCVTFGKTFEQAKEHAAEVLDIWIEELREQKKEIPLHAHRPIVDEVEISFA